MNYCVFDIETDGLIENVTKIHCLSYNILNENLEVVKSGSISDSSQITSFINSQEILVGHNIIRYDLPVMEKVLGLEKKENIIDTLGLSWYLFPMEKNQKGQLIPRRSHSLETWGKELDLLKVQISDWKNLSQKEYIIRCEQDVRINTTLFKKQFNYLKHIYNSLSEVQRIINYLNFKLDCAREQEENPIIINKFQCELYLSKILEESEKKKSELAKNMPNIAIFKTVKRPKNMLKNDGSYSNIGQKWLSLLSSLNLQDSEELTEIKVVAGYEEGNPNSVSQLKDWLFSLGWKPTIYKESKSKSTGEIKNVPQIAEDGRICPDIKRLSIEYPFLENLEGLSILNHRKGIFESFLEVVNDRNEVQAKIDGFTNSLRFQHRKPIVNLPKVGKPWGKEIRGLITVSNKSFFCLCGSDMSALEDTTKQHYMYFFDPEYVKQMRVPGFDPHLDIGVLANMISEQETQFYKDFKKGLIEKNAESEKTFHDIEAKRYLAKTTNFACVYGAGPPKISRTTGMPLDKAQLLHTIYWKRNKAVKQVSNNVKIKEVWGQKWLFNPVSKFWYSLRVEKDAFSVLNQGTGVYCFDMNIRKLREKGIKISLQYHDEWAGILPLFKVEEYRKIAEEAIQEVNKEIVLNVPLGISIDFGENYSLIH